MTDMRLHFDGPYTFMDGADSIFTSRWARSAGVYLWTIRQQKDKSHLVHYVGETTELAIRHRQHLINILGLYYGIFDADDARQGSCTALWKGLWREKNIEATPSVIFKYQQLHSEVLRYVEAITIFFAELKVDSQLRKHIEGCLGWSLRTSHPDCKQLYPDDNHVGTMADKLHGQLLLTAGDNIRGLNPYVPY